MSRRMVGALLCALVAVGCTREVDAVRSTVRLERTAGVVADGLEGASVVVTLLDGDGRPLSGVSVRMSATGEGNTLLAPGVTNAEGVARGRIASTRAEEKTLSFSAELKDAQVALSEHPTVLFVPGPATHLAFRTPPATGRAGAPLAPEVQVGVEDAHGNPVSTWNRPVRLALEGGPAGARLEGVTQAAPEQGLAHFASLRLETPGSGYALVASTEGLAAVVSAPFAVTSGVALPQASSFSADSGRQEANGTSPVVLTLVLRDALGHRVASQPVSVSATGTGNTLTPSSGTTDATGTFRVAFTSTQAEKKTVTASFGEASLHLPVTFVPGRPSSTTSTLVASGTATVADGASTLALTLTVRDAQGRPIPEERVEWSVSGSGNALVPGSALTDANGVLTATLTSTRAEPKTVTVTLPFLQLEAPVSFVAGPASAAASTLTASMAAPQTPGTHAATVRVALRDAQGNGIAGRPVSLTTSNADTTLTPVSGITDDAGLFMASLTAPSRMQTTLTADVGDFVLTQDVTFGCTALVLGDDNAQASGQLVAALQAQGVLTTLASSTSDAYAGTPAATDFSAVVVLVGNNYGRDMALAGQTAIANANAGGVGVVFTEWAAYQVSINLWAGLKNLLLFQRSGGTTSRLTFTLEQAGHPIWEGLPTSFQTVNDMGTNTGNTLINGGVRIAGCAQCEGVGVAVKEAPGRIVQIAHAANYSNGFNTWTNDANTTAMMVNAVRWAGRCL